jgi:hypothetical protein
LNFYNLIDALKDSRSRTLNARHAGHARASNGESEAFILQQNWIFTWPHVLI